MDRRGANRHQEVSNERQYSGDESRLRLLQLQEECGRSEDEAREKEIKIIGLILSLLF